MRPVTPRGRDRDFERVLTFIDAIAAVAITLLVLPLVAIAADLPAQHGSVSDLIRMHSGQFWAFALSFFVIAQAWLAQHDLMRPVVAANPAVLRWLLLWSGGIVFLPFPTALLPAAGNQALTKILYIGTLIVSSLCLAALATTIRQHPALLETDHTPPPPARPAVVNVVLLLTALSLSLLIPPIGYYPLLLLAGPHAVRAWHRVAPSSPHH